MSLQTKEEYTSIDLVEKKQDLGNFPCIRNFPQKKLKKKKKMLTRKGNEAEALLLDGHRIQDKVISKCINFSVLKH